MSYDQTDIYQFRKPHIGNDWGFWGTNLNYNWDSVDSILDAQKRKVITYNLRELDAATQALGQYYKIGDDISLDVAPTTISVGTSRLILDVTSGTAALTVSGTALQQNTLNETSVTEQFGIESGNKYSTNNFFTKDVDLSCDSPCVADIYTFAGFSLDKNVKTTKIILKAVCTDVDNQLTLNVLYFDITGHLATIETFDDLDISHTFTSGSYFFWQRELSLIRDLIRNEKEIIITLQSSNPGTWKDLEVILYIE